MKLTLLSTLAVLASALTLLAAEPASSGPVYELRIYYAAEGKLDDLHARFRNHTMKLFEKHGMKNLYYLVPEGENPQRKLVYFLEHASRAAASQSWKAFVSDPEWQQVARDTEKNGRLVSKVDHHYLQLTDYSAKPVLEKKGDRIFEMRTYTTPDGKLDDLNARFRNHTVNLFKKHGMENIAYWVPTSDQKDSRTTLVYLLAHKSREAARASFDAFRQDPAWLKAKTESEKDGSLTAKDGVKSEFLIPVDYSPIK
jgi:hypothetical protein